MKIRFFIILAAAAALGGCMDLIPSGDPPPGAITDNAAPGVLPDDSAAAEYAATWLAAAWLTAPAADGAIRLLGDPEDLPLAREALNRAGTVVPLREAPAAAAELLTERRGACRRLTLKRPGLPAAVLEFTVAPVKLKPTERRP